MSSLGHRLLFSLALCGALFANTGAVQAQGRSDAALAALERTPHVPNQVLVQFQYGIAEEAKDTLRHRVDAQPEEVVVSLDRRSDLKGDLGLWNLPPGLTIAQAVRDLERDLSIEFVEPNW